MASLLRLLAAVTVLWISSTSAIAQLDLTIDEKTANQNEMVDVDVRVSGFTRYIGVQFSIAYDSTVLEFVELDNITPELRGLIFGTPPNLRADRVTCNWFDFSTPSTIADGDIFVTLRFKAIGNPGTSSDISLDNVPTVIEAVNEDGDAVAVNVDAGKVDILNGGTPDPLLNLLNRSSDPGQMVCVPMRVQDFTDVRAFEFDLSWDPSIINFTTIRNLNLSELDNGDFNTSNAGSGELRVAWVSSATNGVTLANNTDIFEICYDAVGSPGSSTTINFDNVVSSPTVRTSASTVTITGTTIDGLAFIVNDGMGPLGGQQCLDVTVNDFENITAFQYTMNYDPSVARFDTIININPELAGVVIFGLPGQGDIDVGRLTAAWFDFFGKTFNDGTVLYTVCFTAIDADCEDTFDLSFSGDESPILISNTDGEVEPSDYMLVAGTATVTCGIEITIDDVVDVSCNGGDDGSIFTTITPAGGNYEIRWDGDLSNSEDLGNATAGKHVITVVDLDNPDSTYMAMARINEPPAIVITGSVTGTTGGLDNGSISTSVSGGTGTLSCSWSSSLLTSCDGGDNLPCDTYTLTVTDENNCSSSMDFVVECGSVDLMVTIQRTAASCAAVNGDCDGSLIVTAQGVGPFSYTLDGVDFDGVADELCPGNYEVVVTDTGNGNMTDMQTVTIDGPDAIVVTTTVIAPSGVDSSDASIIINSIAGGTPPYNILWTGGSTSDTLSGIGVGLYMLTVTDGAGCMLEQMVEVMLEVTPPGDCFQGIPVITPNGDTANDRLVISCVENNSTELRVFNRWGQLVWRQDGYDNTWEGLDFSGDPLPENAYFWVLLVDLPDGSQREVKGYVNLLRDLRK